jgi:GT2 family glycosyltransferase
VSTIPISVVVPTRNRPQDAESCVRSILANPDADFELVVVDQSEEGATKDRLMQFAGDPRFQYLRSPTRGVSHSRNAGIEATRAPIIAFTDDDCRVTVDWVAGLKKVFTANPGASVVFGRVVVPEDVDGINRWAASFEPGTREYENTFPKANVAWGIGANMACRRAVFEKLGAFDPMLGPGAKFAAAEEYDLTIRALAAGMKVLNVAEVSVLHLGVRDGKLASKLVGAYGMAIGAALSKHVRLGTPHGARLLASWVAYHGGRAVLRTVTGQRPTNLRFVGGLLWGIARSTRQPINAARFIYVDEGRA